MPDALRDVDRDEEGAASVCAWKAVKYILDCLFDLKSVAREEGRLGWEELVYEPLERLCEKERARSGNRILSASMP